MRTRTLLVALTLSLPLASALADTDTLRLPTAEVGTGRVWHPQDAVDYTGMAPESSPASIAALPVWNSRLAHNYDGDAGAQRSTIAPAPRWTAASAHDYNGDPARL